MKKNQITKRKKNIQNRIYTNRFNSLVSILFLIIITLISCSNTDGDQDGGDDMPTIPIPISAASITLAFDHGNDNSSKDIYIEFQKSTDENKLLEYRLIIKKTESDFPSDEELEGIITSNYYKITKNGSNQSFQIDESFNDIEGNSIISNQDYDLKILAIANSADNLNSSSSIYQLRLENTPYYDVETLGLHPNNVEQLSINRNTNYIYSPSFPSESIYKMDIETGSSQLVENISSQYGPLGGNFDRSSQNYYSSSWYLNSVFKYDENDNRSLFASGIPTPTGIAFDLDNNMYVSSYETGVIYKVDTDGNVSPFASSPYFETLDGLVFVNNDLYAVNFTTSKILKITPEANVSLFAELPTPSGAFTGYITFVNEKFYVPSNNEIYSIDLSGNISKIAGRSTGYLDGPAPISKFNGANGINSSISGDTIFIGDKTKIRMLIKRN